MHNVSFCGRFEINSTELSKLSMMQKLKFLKQKDKLVDEFCKQGSSFEKTETGYIVDIKDNQESQFLEILNNMGIIATKM